MLHLFNRVYIKHESMFETVNESLMVRSERKAHPLAFLVSMAGAELPSFEEILKDRYEDSIDNFWKELVLMPADKKYSIFVDSKVLIQLMLQFWKSIFKNPSVDSLFRLYNFSILDNKLKSYLIKDDRVKNKAKFNEAIGYISKDEFIELYNNAPKIQCLMDLDKSALGFEYLLGNYFVPEVAQYKDFFEERLGKLAWSSWFADTQILRGELLTGFYDLNKLLPNLNLNLDEPISIDQTILENKHLAWMLDPKFEENNMDYILRKYGKDIFIDLNQHMVFAKGAESKKGTITDNQLFFNYQVNLTNLVFDENYEEFLKQDIADGFGCQLINDDFVHKANQLFVSYIYDKVRSNEPNVLKEYELI